MKKTLLKTKIYDYVAENVQNGVFTPGTKISEESIASVLGVSRTPVREALTQLALEDVVERIPRRGFFVGKTEKNVSKEVFEVIGYLDKLVAELACPFLLDEDYKKMEELIAKIDVAIKYENYSEYARYQNHFHEVYANACPNKMLINTMHTLTHSHIPHTYMGEGTELYQLFAASNKQHRHILDAFINKDIDRLKQLVDEHWSKIEYEQYL